MSTEKKRKRAGNKQITEITLKRKQIHQAKKSTLADALFAFYFLLALYGTYGQALYEELL